MYLLWKDNIMVPEYSVEAKKLRAEYYRARYARDPERCKHYQNQVWENKAKTLYGADYIPPDNEGELSAQARLLKRGYYRKYRKEHIEQYREYMRKYQKEHKTERSREKQREYIHNYWERKAQNNEG